LTARRWLASIACTLAGTIAIAGHAAAQPVENELVMIGPVGKGLYDAMLEGFRRHAKARWNIDVKTAALAAGTPMAYGRVVEWKGRPEVDVFWGGDNTTFDRLATQGLLAPLDLPPEVADLVPLRIGKPQPLDLKDEKGFWIGTLIESTGIVYHPRVLQRLGVPPLKDWDDLLDRRLKGQVVQTPPTRSSSSHASYEVLLQRDGEEKGWSFLRQLAGNTGLYATRSRDVPSVVARGEFAVGFGVPAYFAFEDRLAGFDIRYVAPKTAWLTNGAIAVVKGAKHPRAAKAFVEFVLSEAGQRILIERGLYPINARMRVAGPPGSNAELAVEFNGGRRSYFEGELVNVYDDALAQKRYEAVNQQYRKEIEAVADDLKRK